LEFARAAGFGNLFIIRGLPPPGLRIAEVVPRNEELGTLSTKRFPELRLDAWEETKITLHLFAQIVGKGTARSIKEQLGQTVEQIKENKRKGQISLNDF